MKEMKCSKFRWNARYSLEPKCQYFHKMRKVYFVQKASPLQKFVFFYFFSSYIHLQYKGFPKNFTSCKDLETFLTRFIWLPVKHAANSYPLVPYGAYVPVAPTKLYSDPSDTKAFAHNLPNVAIALVRIVTVDY